MKSNYRNTRTSNGLKRGLHVDWDTPKRKPNPKPNFNAFKFLNDCVNDEDAYSKKERAAFRKVLDLLNSVVLENESLRQAAWDEHDKHRLVRDDEQ